MLCQSQSETLVKGVTLVWKAVKCVFVALFSGPLRSEKDEEYIDCDRCGRCHHPSYVNTTEEQINVNSVLPTMFGWCAIGS